MKNNSLFKIVLILPFLFYNHGISLHAESFIRTKGPDFAVLQNRYIEIRYDLTKGNYSCLDKKNNRICIKDAVFEIADIYGGMSMKKI